MPICLVDTIQNSSTQLSIVLWLWIGSKALEWMDQGWYTLLPWYEGDGRTWPLSYHEACLCRNDCVNCCDCWAQYLGCFSRGLRRMWVYVFFNAVICNIVLDLGRFVSNSWAITLAPLNDLHNPHNAQEVQRLREEHPVEDDLIVYHRTWGHTRCAT